MNLTKNVIEMIKKRCTNKFSDAYARVNDIGVKIAEQWKKREKGISQLVEEIASKASEEFKKKALKEFPDIEYRPDCSPVTSYSYAWSLPKPENQFLAEYVKLFDDTLEACKRIAIENSPRTAFDEIDRYLDRIDPVKALFHE